MYYTKKGIARFAKVFWGITATAVAARLVLAVIKWVF